ncbi:MAG: tRNA (adenosine(37)-N6)-threonylcarbamoyltransferase complex dimerization subunit type 1 TsaB [SAR324 cluster bacterium]|nr:tRNA (adenosine(37)-N6)-threonylcarbamoyltransferase complex dimerization subunit type 1 TsaB [SAR324 cluster bacterium]
MTNALAIDTTSEFLGLALMKAGRLAANHYEATGTEMNRSILTVLDDLLARAALKLEDLELIAVARGPGSFTGTRIGLAVAKSFALVQGLPLVGVDTLRLLAAQGEAAEGECFYAVLNCVRDEVYHAAFRWEGEGPQPLGEIGMSTLAALPELVEEAPVVLRRFPPEQPGHEESLAKLNRLPLRHPAPDCALLLSEALRMHRAHGGRPLSPAEPIYLKPEAFRKWKP